MLKEDEVNSLVKSEKGIEDASTFSHFLHFMLQRLFTIAKEFLNFGAFLILEITQPCIRRKTQNNALVLQIYFPSSCSHNFTLLDCWMRWDAENIFRLPESELEHEMKSIKTSLAWILWKNCFKKFSFPFFSVNFKVTAKRLWFFSFFPAHVQLQCWNQDMKIRNTKLFALVNMKRFFYYIKCSPTYCRTQYKKLWAN